MDSKFPRGVNKEKQRVFNPNDETDQLQPILSNTGGNPKGRDLNSGAGELLGTPKEEIGEVPNMHLKFILHGVEIIGDLSAFSLAKAKGLVRYGHNGALTQKSYGSTFNFITINYLVAHVRGLNEVSSKVFLTVGLCDQFINPHATSEFQKYYSELISLLIAKGAQDILILVPPPNLRTTHFLDFEFLQHIRQVVKQTMGPPGSYLALMNIDPLCFTLIDESFDILGVRPVPAPRGGTTRHPNISINTRAYDVQNRSKQYFLTRYVAEAMETYIQQFSHHCDSRPPAPKQVEVERPFTQDGSESEPMPLVKSPHEPAVVEPREGSEAIPSIQAASVGKLLPEPELRTFMYLPMYLKSGKLGALVDTGASLGVIREDICRDILEKDPQLVRSHRLTVPVVMRVADGDVMTLTEIVAIRFGVTADVQLYAYFVVAPKLIQEIIIGMAMLRRYKSIINIGESTITFALPAGVHCTVAVESAVTEWRSFTIEPLNLEPFIQEDLDFLMAEQAQLCHINDPIEPIRKELMAQVDRAVSEKTITPKEANEALSELIPLAHAFGPETGSYKWGEVKFEFVLTQPWVKKTYGTALIYQKQIRAELQRMLQCGMIEVRDSEWIHPIVVVPKSGESIRICIDASSLNSTLKPIHHDTRKIEQILLEPSTGGLFSSFDFSQGFMQVPLAPEAGKYLAFQFEGITYCYKTLPYGTAVSSAIFNRIVRSVVYRGKPWDEPETSTPNFNVSDTYVRTYVDDILIQTPNFKEHLAQMRIMLENVIKSGMTLGIKKSTLFVRRINFLGHQLQEGFVTKNLEKAKFFVEFEKQHLKGDKLIFPRKQTVQRLVGFLNWFSRFIPDFAADVEPFLELIRSPPPLKTSDTHLKAYYSLKHKFLQDFRLHRLRFDRPFYIKIRPAEAWATGCIFQRGDTGDSNVVTFFSFRFPEVATNKVSDIRGYYALYYLLFRFKDLLVGTKIILDQEIGRIIRKYHESVEVGGVLAKWYMVIAAFDLDYSGTSENDFKKIIEMLEQFSSVTCETITDDLMCLEDIHAITRSMTKLKGPDLNPEIISDTAKPTASEDKRSTPIINPCFRDIPEEMLECVSEALERLAEHQANDPFCQAKVKEVTEIRSSSFVREKGILYKKTSDEFLLQVIPKHMIVDLIRYLHIAYCHPGIAKTILIFKRQFYHCGIDAIVVSIISQCIDCKHNKISSVGTEPQFQSTLVSSVGTLFVDHFGPLPIKRGGVQAVLVAMDRLSNYVQYQPVGSLTAAVTIKAMDKIINHFTEIGVVIHTVVTDNAPCFRSAEWARFLAGRNVRMKKVTPYNPNANAVERQMRELGTGLRMRLNHDGEVATSHRLWDRELDFLQNTSNETPKSHRYSPKQILGLPQLSRDPTESIPIHCPDPIFLAQELLADRSTSIDFVIRNNPSPRATTTKFSRDGQGRVVIFCDGAARSDPSGATSIAAASIWV